VSPDEYLRVPYTMIIASVRRADGAWVRRAEYPELSGCVAEADSPLDAIDQLDMLREELILGRLARGEPVPLPRPPLARLPSRTLDSPTLNGREAHEVT
jgi:predicted RNase H-like HicB family nuclease